jgi:hypothetical protein
MSSPLLSTSDELKVVKFLANALGDSSILEAIEDGRQFRWYPLQDISIHELAMSQYLLGLIFNGKDLRLQQRTFDALPAGVQRHFLVTAI